VGEEEEEEAVVVVEGRRRFLPVFIVDASGLCLQKLESVWS
jgi:hypothetical protein